MRFKELYIVRHGQTDYNLKGIIQGSGIDANLNETGWKQAQRFYEKYKDEGFELGYSSSLKRAQQTIEPFRKIKSFPIHYDERIKEINWGVHEGKPYSKELKKDYNSLINDWSNNELDSRLRNAESGRELFKRITHFYEDLWEKDEEKILICSHGRTIRAMLSYLTQSHPSSMENFHHANCGLYHIKWSPEDFNLLKRNDTIHLPKELIV